VITNPYVILGIILGSLLALGSALGYGYHRGALSKAEEIGTLKARIETLNASGKTCLEAVDKLRTANEQLANDRKEDKRKADQALLDVIQQRDKYADEARAALAKREIVYVQDKQAGDWADAPIPDSIVDLLWADQAGDANGDRGGQDPGAGSPPQGSYRSQPGTYAPEARLVQSGVGRLY
jgi:hypothetical protein